MPPAAPSPADDPAERELLRRVIGGDRAALAELYRAYHRRLCRFLTRLTHRPDVIDEAINDCFWIVWQKAAGFRGDSRVSTWIMGIAYRCALKALRQHGELAQQQVSEATPENEGLAADAESGRELRDWLDKGLERLPVEQRLVLELAYGGGHSLEEIADITQCPVSTVKARMFHARIKLRNLLPALASSSSAATGTGGPP
jgi:RNA polymerase sigma-70 factor, ECF subfamily